MKVKIDIVEGLEEEEVTIRCAELNDFCIGLQNYLSKQNNGKRCLLLTDGGTDFFIRHEGGQDPLSAEDTLYLSGEVAFGALVVRHV